MPSFRPTRFLLAAASLVALLVAAPAFADSFSAQQKATSARSSRTT